MKIKLEIEDFDEIKSLTVDGEELGDNDKLVKLITKLCESKLDSSQNRKILAEILYEMDHKCDTVKTGNFGCIKTWRNL